MLSVSGRIKLAFVLAPAFVLVMWWVAVAVVVLTRTVTTGDAGTVTLWINSFLASLGAGYFVALFLDYRNELLLEKPTNKSPEAGENRSPPLTVKRKNLN